MSTVNQRVADGDRAPRARRPRRGSAILLVAASLSAVIGFLALALDLATLFDARSEAQRAADAAALAGASAYLDHASPWDAEGEAVDRARGLATANAIRNRAIAPSELTIQPSPADFAVYVKVRREAVPLLFARIFSMRFSDVEASAVAEAAAASEIACMKPFAIPDEDYTPEDIGQLDTLKAADENAATGSGVDSYFFPIVLPHDPNITQTCPQAGNEWGGFHRGGATVGGNCGANSPGTGSCWYRANICNRNCAVMSTGVPYPVEKGDMDGPSAQGINALLAADPNVEWDPNSQRLTRDGSPIDFAETGRVIKVALYAKSTYFHPSQTTIQFTGFAYWFLEFANETQPSLSAYYDPAQQAPILGRFLFYAPGTGGGEVAGPFSRYLRLIQ